MSQQEMPELLNDIAIIGMSGRFPGAQSVEEFWQNLCQGKEAITFFTEEELLAEGVDPDLLRNPNYVKAGAVLQDIDQFDASFFGFNPLEASILDPQHRLFLECAWESLEQAGYRGDTYKGTISVFAGAGMNKYLLYNVLPNRDQIVQALGEHPVMIGNDKDFLPLRVSYKLNLTGASVNVQSACSTSLVAVHLACQSLLAGECDMALAGGVTVAVPNKVGYLHQQGLTSQDGHCRPFDHQASGTVFGSGVGVVVLKRLEDALADGDTIYAVIKGSAVNNDGVDKMSFTAPSVSGQVRVISEALAMAGVEPDTIGYLEAHGTGTAIGDPIELSALTQAFQAESDRTGFCAIGSVKANVGHLDTASGVTGLIKTTMALAHKVIPPMVHFERPNPQIDFEKSPFYVNKNLIPWPEGDTPRRAGVSSFGFGGTNAHVVLEEAPPQAPSGPSRPYQLLLLSAKTATALEAATDRLAGHLQAHPQQQLADVAYTLQVGRKAFEHRRFLVCQDGVQAAEALARRDVKRVLTSVQSGGTKQVAFMFSGAGSQYVNMALELYQTEAVFREQVDRCCAWLKQRLGFDLREAIYPELMQVSRDRHDLYQTDMAQIALFVIEYSLGRLLMEWGIEPQAMIGHSIGEYVAACLAEVLTLEEAMTLVLKRGQLFKRLPEGAMLAVSMTEEELRPLLGPELSLAAVNGPAQCVVAGSPQAVLGLQEQLQLQGVNVSRVHIDRAAHSHMLDRVLDEFRQVLRSFALKPPKIPFVSNVTGTWITEAQATSPDYWAAHLRQTVRFADGVKTLCQDPDRVLLEVGPGKTLSSFAVQTVNGSVAVLPTIRHVQDAQSDVAFLLGTLGRLWLYGVEANWEAFAAGEDRRRVPLPTYPFERQRYWCEASPASMTEVQAVPERKMQSGAANLFYLPQWKREPLALSPEREAALSQRWLVFLDRQEAGLPIVERARALGHQVTTVSVGDSFGRTGDDAYVLNPYDVSAYRLLIGELQREGRLPETVVHLWSVTGDQEGAEGEPFFDEMQGLGFYSLLYLTKALDEWKVKDLMEFWVISDHLYELESRDLLIPEKNAVVGICRVIPQEYTHITCRVLDVPLVEGNPAQRARFVEQFFDELKAKDSHRLIAYRGRRRWVQTFAEESRMEHLSPSSRLREQGVYLVTGGFGTIGSRVAEHLAKSVRAKLILVGRVELPEREHWGEWLMSHEASDPVSTRIRQIQALEELGSEVLAVRADVTDEGEMQKAVACAVETFGVLNGVIHAAGGNDERYFVDIADIGREECEFNFATKVKALYALSRALPEQGLDFCLLVSSLSCVLGGVGCSAYAAAHHVLEAFAKQKNTEMKTPWLTFSLDFRAMDDLHEILTRAFVVASDDSFVVSKTDLLESIRHWVTFEAQVAAEVHGQEGGIRHARPNLLTPYVEPRNETEERIAQFWKELLGIEQIGVHDNFFELGGNSLVATKLVTRLRSSFEVEVPLRIIFEASTVEDLALVIEELLIREILGMIPQESS
jgi:acyl transferase domain-containing protein